MSFLTTLLEHMIQQVVCAGTRCLLGFMVASSVGFSPKKTAGVGAAQAEVPGDLHSTAAAPLEQGTETSSVHLGPRHLPSPIGGLTTTQQSPQQLWKGKQDRSRHSALERV